MGYVKIPAATNRTTDFTSSGSWVCPAGVYSAEFFVVGGGGGGGGGQNTSAANYSVAGGGGGGAVKRVELVTTPGSTYTITVGAKGTGASNAAGTNAGFSEVILSGTTLIRCYGGQGGAGNVTGSATQPTTSRVLAGGGGQAGGESASATQYGGGGGGASNGFNNLVYATNSVNYSSEGSPGGLHSNTAAQQYHSFGAVGIDGYGAGGSAGYVGTAGTRNQSGQSYFAGVGAFQTTTGIGSGTAATENTGCGGGGGAAHTNTTAYSGGNGADGLVRITYFA
jgi:hypothetical protein